MKAKLVKIDYQYFLYDVDDNLIATTENSPYKKLSLKKCQAIELDYDLDELVENEVEGCPKGDERLQRYYGFINGFQKALELMGDKKFSEKDINTAYSTGYEDGKRNENFWRQLIQSLQQTEWDVEVVMVPALSNNGNVYYGDIPKLDEDKCLILKRI